VLENDFIISKVSRAVSYT